MEIIVKDDFLYTSLALPAIVLVSPLSNNTYQIFGEITAVYFIF